MKSVDTKYKPGKGNPIAVGRYLVYGAGRPDPSGDGFQAWYWIDVPGENPTRVRGDDRFGTELYPTADLAAAMAVSHGATTAGKLP